jgi:hypothetical protein
MAGRGQRWVGREHLHDITSHGIWELCPEPDFIDTLIGLPGIIRAVGSGSV